MRAARRPLTARSLLLAAVVVLSAGQLAMPDAAGAEEPADVAAGDTVVGELVQAWPEHQDPAAAAEHAEEGPLTWVETRDGEAVRIPTESIEDVARAQVGATVEVTVGDEVADEASEAGLDPAREVLEAAVVQAAPAAPAAPTAASGTPTHAVTVVMAVPGGGVSDHSAMSTVVDLVDGPVAAFWSGQSDGAVRIGVTAAVDRRGTPLAADCSDPFGLMAQAAASVGWTSGPGRHLLVHLPESSAGCAAGLAGIGTSLGSGGRLYVSNLGSSPETMGNVVAHELGHNFGLGHASAEQCDRVVAGGTCRVVRYDDWYDVMGISWHRLGTLNAPHAARLGLLPSAERVALTRTSPSATYSLAPAAAAGGTRAISLTGSDGTVHWLENRQAVGQDTWLSSPLGDVPALDTGVLLRRAAGQPDTSLLLDGTPSAPSGWDADIRVALPVGTPVPVAGGEFTVTVQSVGSTATVQVTPRAGASADGTPELGLDQTLTAGQSLVSPVRRYRAVTQADGDLVVYAADGRVLWASNAHAAGARLVLQRDGNLVSLAPDGRRIWESRTAGRGAARLVMQDNGDLVLWRADGVAVWSTGWDTPDRLRPGQVLEGGQQLLSANQRYRAVAQTDGNLVVHNAVDGRVLWASNRYAADGWTVLQTDGNLVTYTRDGRPVWDTRTWGAWGVQLVMQDNGDLVLWRGDRVPLWSTGWDTPDRLRPGQALAGTQQLVSANGRYRMLFDERGLRVLATSDERLLWENRVSSSGARLVLQPDGNLVTYAPDGRPVWDTRTWGAWGVQLVMQDNGDLVLWRGDRVPLWSTGWDTPDRLRPGQELTEGQRISSPSGRWAVTLVYGNAAVTEVSTGRNRWETNTTEPRYWQGRRLVMQADGNLVLYQQGGYALWSSRTWGNPGAYAVLRDDGRLYVLRADGRELGSH